MVDDVLLCTDATSVTIVYEYLNFEKKQFSYWRGRYDEGSSLQGFTIYDFTETGITYTLYPPVIFITNPNSYLYPNEYANLIVYSGQYKQIDFLEQSANDNDTTIEFIIDAGIYERLVTTNLPFSVDTTPGFIERKEFTYTKVGNDTGIRVINRSLNEIGSNNRFEIEEIRTWDNRRITGRIIETGFLGKVKSYSFLCDGIIDDEDLPCYNKSTVNVEYDEKTTDIINIRLYDYVSGFEFARYDNIKPINGGSLTWEFEEDIRKIKYAYLGTYEIGSYNPPNNNCGDTGYFISFGYIWGNEIDNPLVTRDVLTEILGIYSRIDPINSTTSDRFIAARAITKDIYDDWLANSEGDNANSTNLELLKVNECVTNSSLQNDLTGALSATITNVFKLPNPESWQVVVKEDNEEIFRSAYVVGSGNNNLFQPNNDRVRVTFIASTTTKINKQFDKSRNSGVYVENIPNLDIDGKLTGYTVNLIQKNKDNIVLDTDLIIETTDRLPAPLVTINCIGCPDNTCAVDCGDKICCYGADGIAIDFYLK